jgi:hypothetical protein
VCFPASHVFKPQLLLLLLQVPNISMPLLHLPKPFPINVAAIPNSADVIKALESIFPRGKLTSLPAFVTAPIMPLGTPRLPLLSLRNITIPTIEEIAIEIGAAPPKWFNIDLEKMAQQLSNITWKIPTLPAPLQYTLPATMNFTLPSLTMPDITIPQLPQMQLPNLPGLPKPNLTRLSAAVSSMPDIAADISQWPRLMDQWKVSDCCCQGVGVAESWHIGGLGMKQLAVAPWKNAFVATDYGAQRQLKPQHCVPWYHGHYNTRMHL